jgi:ElaB/YqjD/DUF883 family membrane-anchored ribosome-binding protein
MGQDPGTGSASLARRIDDPAELRAEIERTRRELGDTVAALAEKTDVKARAREKVADVRQTVNERRAELVTRARENSPDGAGSAAVQLRDRAQENPLTVAAIAAFAGGFILGRLRSGRRDG